MKLFKYRKQVHVYMEVSLDEWVAQRSSDLGLSTSSYIRNLIIKDKNEKEKIRG